MTRRAILRGDKLVSYCGYQLPETLVVEAGFSWEGAMREPEESIKSKEKN